MMGQARFGRKDLKLVLHCEKLPSLGTAYDCRPAKATAGQRLARRAAHGKPAQRAVLSCFKASKRAASAPASSAESLQTTEHTRRYVRALLGRRSASI